MSAKDRRITEQLMKYWTELKGSRRFPSETQVDPDKLKDIWARCFLIDAKDFKTGGTYKYSYLGEELIQAFGDQLTEEEAAHLISTSNVEVVEKINQVLRSRAPLIIESEFTNTHNVRIRFREILLPLGSNDENAEFILGGMRWKAF